MTAADYPLRAVAWWHVVPRKHRGARPGSSVMEGRLVCGHTWRRKASAPRPRRVH